MPNAINPNDYNIDFFSSGFLGTTTAEDFRNYLFNLNLQELPPEMVTSPAGNFTSSFEEKGLEKPINYAPITNPGDIDEWLVEGNFNVNLFDISYQNSSQNVGANQYGPSSLQAFAYQNPELIVEDTGYIQYPTSVGGNDFENILLNEQIGLGPGIAINFESPLNDIAKERRKQEAINRVKLKAEDQILGKLNLDPFGLLAGQDLILRDYKITTRPTIVGKVFDFAADAVGLEIPTSPIPKGAFGKYGDDDGPQTYEDLMKSTGSGTKSLIFNSIAKNKYGPTVQEPTGKLANLFGAGQAPQTKKYTDLPETGTVDVRNPLIDTVNSTIEKTVGFIAGDRPQSDDLPAPSAFDNPRDDSSLNIDDISKNDDYGFDDLYINNPTDTWDVKGPTTNTDSGSIGTSIPIDIDEKFYPGTIPVGEKNDGKAFRRGMYWGENRNPFRRGLLKYTQDIVNKANRDQSGTNKARYVGVTNDDTNFETQSGRHKLYSMGNTVLGGEGDSLHYCRSWSVRNPYRKVSDLIRHGVNNGQDSLTRPDLNLSVLDNNGFVKVAPYYSEDIRRKIDARANGESNLNDGVLKLGNPEVQKYMLSIENLAWQNTEHLLRVPPCEVGPNGGRIMWFPPYDINFTDNSSVNWDSTQFIGRGEPIYTYNSTERTGTLTFKVVVDHSIAMTDIKKKGEDALFRYFAGCDDPIEEVLPILPITEVEEIKIEAQTAKIPLPLDPKFEIKEPPAPPPEAQFYFRNARKFAKDTIGTDLFIEISPDVWEEPPNYDKDDEGIPRLWPNGYLMDDYGDVPPLIPNLDPDAPEGQIFIPNPAFSGEAVTNYSQREYGSLNLLATEKLANIAEFLLTPEGKRFKIVIYAKTSEAGPVEKNFELAQERADSAKYYLFRSYLENEGEGIVAENLGSKRTFPSENEWENSPLRWETRVSKNPELGLSISIDPSTGERTEIVDNNLVFGDVSATVPEAVKGRTAIITLEYNPEIDELFINDIVEPVQEYEEFELEPARTETIETTRELNEKEKIAKRLAERASRYMAWECSYFEKMEQDTPFVYENLVEKLKYFHPAFHSMTPEGFNARLTFLKQCTRQGPNVAVGEPSNLAFGKPPICVLRVGDFYHTKIVIDSVNLTFDPIQWDLNPEGIGVQPMLCSVDLNFKFIGGSSLGGPISQLQNAVGFNFFANTGLYNPRTIFSSVEEYKLTRPEAASGLIEEISNEKIKTVGGKDGNFAYGSYLVPGQVITEKGTFESEDITTTQKEPTDVTELKNKQDQAKEEVITKESGLTEDEKKKTENEFNKEPEERNQSEKDVINVINPNGGSVSEDNSPKTNEKVSIANVVYASNRLEFNRKYSYINILLRNGTWIFFEFSSKLERFNSYVEEEGSNKIYYGLPVIKQILRDPSATPELAESSVFIGEEAPIYVNKLGNMSQTIDFGTSDFEPGGYSIKVHIVNAETGDLIEEKILTFNNE